MKVPTLTDRAVKMGAYITDEHFGYDHWQARQFCAPKTAKPAVLVVFDTKDERDAYFERLTFMSAQPTRPDARMTLLNEAIARELTCGYCRGAGVLTSENGDQSQCRACAGGYHRALPRISRLVDAALAALRDAETPTREDEAITLMLDYNGLVNRLWDTAGGFNHDNCNAIRDLIHHFNEANEAVVMRLLRAYDQNPDVPAAAPAPSARPETDALVATVDSLRQQLEQVRENNIHCQYPNCQQRTPNAVGLRERLARSLEKCFTHSCEVPGGVPALVDAVMAALAQPGAAPSAREAEACSKCGRVEDTERLIALGWPESPDHGKPCAVCRQPLPFAGAPHCEAQGCIVTCAPVSGAPTPVPPASATGTPRGANQSEAAEQAKGELRGVLAKLRGPR